MPFDGRFKGHVSGDNNVYSNEIVASLFEEVIVVYFRQCGKSRRSLGRREPGASSRDLTRAYVCGNVNAIVEKY